MSPYYSLDIVNNILERAFAERLTITPFKLQAILYAVACQYAKATDRPLLEEPWVVYENGPGIARVDTYFKPIRPQLITAFARSNAMGETLRIDEKTDPHLRVAIDTVWSTAKHISHEQIRNWRKHPSSACAKADVAQNPTIDHSLMVMDNSYCFDLIIPVR